VFNRKVVPKNLLLFLYETVVNNIDQPSPTIIKMKFKSLLFASILIVNFNQKTENNTHMGLFNRLFGKNQPSKTEKAIAYNQEIEKTSEMLDETVFWNIVDLSVKSTKNQDQQERFLVKELEKLTPKEIIGFRLRTDKLLYDTYTSNMWCAGYIMNGGCSDDGFEYFRNWIISRGKDTYYKAKENPDSLIKEYIEGEEYYEFESFWYVALTAFQNITGKELHDYIADDFKTNEGNYINFEFTWQEEEPESMKAICPKLYSKMWN
jgi:hypothetical protein